MKALRTALGVLSSRALLVALLTFLVVVYLYGKLFTDKTFPWACWSLATNTTFRAIAGTILAVAAASLVRGAYVRFRSDGARAVLWLPAPLGLWIYALGFVVSYSTREQGWVVVGNGDKLKPLWERTPSDILEVKSPLVEEHRTSEDSIFLSFKPRVVVKTPERTVEVGPYPPEKTGDTWFNVMDFGAAPFVRIKRMGLTAVAGFVPLRVLPPGTVGTFTPQDLDIQVDLEIIPNNHLELREGVKREFDFEAPVYHLVAYRGGKVVAEGTSEEPVKVDEYEITVGRSRWWAWVQYARDKGRHLVGVGLSTAMVGAPLWLSWVLLGVRRRLRERQPPLK